MEQQPVVDRGVVDPGPPTDTDLTGTAAAPTSTVVSEGEWLAVSTEGFSEQQRGRPLAYLVKELVQNVLDCRSAWKIDPLMECAPGGGQIGRFRLIPLAGLPEDGSHDETSITQRRVQTASR